MPYPVQAALRSPFLLFTLLMAAKFYMTSAVIWGNTGLFPLWTALPTVWAAFGLIEWTASKRKIAAYAAVNLLFTCIYFAVIMYYKYFGIIVTYHALSQVGQVTEVKGSVFQLMHPYFLLIFTDLLVMAGLLVWHRGFRRWATSFKPLRGARIAYAALAVAMIGICLVQVLPNRGIVNELKRAERMGIINYEIYTMFDSGSAPSAEYAAVTPAAVRQVKGVERPDSPAGWQVAEGRHIFYVQLEAFQSFLLGLSVEGREITPALNSLIRQGVYFPRVYQQVGAGNTSDAEFTTNTSLMTPPVGAASETYSGKQLPSLAKLLHGKGYDTMTFHTNDVKFWNRDQLYDAIGFDRYYDREFYQDEDLVHFGSSDEVLYRKTADELAALAGQGKRLYANIVSMSAHHPFNLPAHKAKIDLPERFDGTFVGDYLVSQNYADASLGGFIEQLQASGLWEDSLIVIYGDHMGVPIYSLTDDDLRLLEELNGKPYDYTQMLNIPFLLVAPGALEPAVMEQVGGHSDIMPTVANLAGIRLTDTVVFGQDLLNATSTLLPLRYYLPSGSFINDRVIYVPGAGFEDGITYPLAGEQSKGLQNVTKSEFERALQLMQMSHAYVSGLPDREK
jgi:lipoteichoic acid synthase